MVFKIFISYSQFDFSGRARSVHNYLSRMFPDDDIFIDQSKSKAKKWREENDKKLEECDLVLLIITPAALKSDEVEREVGISNDLNKMILPCKMNANNLDWNELKWNLGSLDGITFENSEDLLTSLFSAVDKIRKEHLNKSQNISDSSSNTITVHLDRQTYSDGDKILISGQVKELLSNMDVSMIIIDPNDQIVGLDQIEVGSDKKYSIEFTTGGPLMKNEGNYTVIVRYGSAYRTTKTTFSFTGSSVIPKSLTTDEFIVMEGSNSEIKYRIQGGKVISAVKIVGTSSLIFGIESTEKGEINLTVPRSLLDARIENNDDDFFVLIDGNETDFDEVKTDDERILTISFSAHSKEIEIIGIPDVLPPLSSIFESPKSIQNQNDQIHEISLTVSFDRTVYPLRSKLYVRVNCQDIIFGKDINLEILNSENKIIASKQIDPITYPDSELKQAGIYQESFKMNETDWKVGELYTIRASHGNAITEDNCTIDERTPVVQTDKSVYLLGSDMIITVIDPDADKDSQKPEFIGNSPESFLTISSSSGKIEGYKLRETGDSTGIFQGIIELIRTSDDSTTAPYVLGEENISKTHGSGIYDGVLQVKRNDEIKITYKRKSDVTTLSAFPSNFGATIELDQKVYTWTDKVRITVVAPDYNTDSNKVERIGNNANGTITIKTRMGKIENYELVETGSDTGIFVGEIRLTGFQYDKLPQKIVNNFGKTFGKGSRDGVLATASDDGLTVEFKTQTETIVASALIRWNIGEVQWKQATYSLGDTGSFIVIDPDMNIDPNLNDIFKVRIWSDSDPVGTEIFAIETGPETGIFSGSIQFGTKTEDGKVIKVSPRDSVVVEYVDFTLPDPYQNGNTLTISGTTKIKI